MARVFKLWLYPDFIYKYTQMSKEFNESVEYMHNITDEVWRKIKPKTIFFSLEKYSNNLYLYFLR